MSQFFGVVRRYPALAATIAVAAVAGILLAVGQQQPGQWLLAGFSLLIAARSVWSMVQQLRSGTFGIDILAVTAISASVAVGEYWAAIVIVLMLTGGEGLEDFAANRAKQDLTALLARRPQTAHRLVAENESEDITISAIVPGERILVRANEVVPIDGILVSSFGTFDESSLTGESLPVERRMGEEVLSGGVNGATSVVLTVTRAAKDSQYQQIVSLVEEAAASKAPMVRLADQYAMPFTFIALAIAGVAWWVAGDPVRFAEVLVVATPCPLIIAAPVAFMAGMSRSAREGAIVKSSATLEKLRKARSFAFDKTGTLTYGHPRLVDIHSVNGLSADVILRSAAAAEQSSAHTLAAAVVSEAKSRHLVLSGVEHAEESTANGITATLDGRTVVVGKRSFIERATGSEITALPLQPGELAISVAIDGIYEGALILRDEIRDNARETLNDLSDQGISHIVMLTGDDTPTALYVAAQLAVQDVRANCLPVDKVEAVKGLQERPVVMVGDGVNDAPVLAAADVGIAMGARGSTAASESADVVILRDDISLVARALAVGRETVNVALQSIWVGIVLSLSLMVIATFGILPAVVGAWLQEGVDVICILWALRAATGSSRIPSRGVVGG